MPRLPRTRGDRPARTCSPTRTGPAAPHTRGSTRNFEEHPVDDVGCPAHAGIDPEKQVRRARRDRLPRTRGDRPAKSPGRSRGLMAAPHTRGSTPRGEPRPSRRGGCPAHAGIDQRLNRARSRALRLPRTRGDRPSSIDSDQGSRAAAPHTRGSTRDSQRAERYATGCPAHAGIDPTSSTPSAPRAWLPRTRGDRPWCFESRRVRIPAAPHTRGSTLDAEGKYPRDSGCPAHAGIDPLGRAGWRSSLGLPRTRGDRPSPIRLAGSSAGAAPHTRGSTRGQRGPRGLRAGCPAHAGIDPRTTSEGRDVDGLPRTRGDRPLVSGQAGAGNVAAPHTRGSTRCRLGARLP